MKVASVLRPGGHFAFTVEAATADDDVIVNERGYRLQKSGRFGYSAKYMDRIVQSLDPKFLTLM